MGDFNARLARVGDKKPNVIATAEFENLLTCNLDILNEKFAKGVPTFVNISDEKKGSSIIDLVLSNCTHLVENFKVVDKTLGSTPHSAHRIVTFQFKVSSFEKPKSKKKKCVWFTS